jgi:hypothetical protein
MRTALTQDENGRQDRPPSIPSALRHWKSEEIKERCQMTHTFCRGGDSAAESVMLYSDSGKMWMQKEE